MKTIYLLIKFFSIMLMGILIIGCSHRGPGDQKAHIDPPSKYRTSFTKGIPKDIQGKFHRSELSKDAFTDDQFYTLNISKHDMISRMSGDSFTDIDFRDASYHEIEKKSYVLEAYGRYIKVVLLKNGDLQVSENLPLYNDALEATKMTTYSHEKPDFGFGISAKDIEKKYYVSNSDFTRYFYFEGGTIPGFTLWKVNNDATESLLVNFDRITAKKGRYLLSHSYDTDDNYLTLARISENELRNEETGEVFSLYKGDKYSPKEAAWEKMGVKPPAIKIITPEPKPKAVPKYPDKYSDPNYDPELDDDYLDDYNQAEFEDEF